MSKPKRDDETAEPRGHRLTAGQAATTVVKDSDGNKRGEIGPGMARDYTVNTQTGKSERVRPRSDGE